MPASRPADVLALMGHDTINQDSDPRPLAAVLRSWEDRFGATLLEVGFAHIRLLAQRPPRALPEAQAVAAELWAMCDEFWPAGTMSTALWGVTDIAAYILTTPIWSLWLDLRIEWRRAGPSAIWPIGPDPAPQQFLAKIDSSARSPDIEQLPVDEERQTRRCVRPALHGSPPALCTPVLLDGLATAAPDTVRPLDCIQATTLRGLPKGR